MIHSAEVEKPQSDISKDKQKVNPKKVNSINGENITRVMFTIILMGIGGIIICTGINSLIKISE